MLYSAPFEEYGTWNDTTVVERGTQVAASSVGGCVMFPENTTLVDLRIGSSFIGFEQAAVNLSKEIQKGYVASDKTNEAVARTLEFALDDYCIAQMADSLGHRQGHIDLMKRCKGGVLDFL